MSAKNKKSKKAKQAFTTIPTIPIFGETSELVDETTESRHVGTVAYIKRHWVAACIVALAAVTVVASGLKYLDEDAKRQKNLATGERSAISRINPFMPPPPPSPTPQLSREYLYAGSRLLAVEDANANAGPPADLAVWRPSNGMFYVLGGPGSQQTYFPWGTQGDRPAIGDFDGDGKTDFSIFRPSTGVWWVV